MKFHSAREIVGKLKGRWVGRSGMCPCPAHEDRSPSLSVSQTHDGRVLVFCHAGCEQLAVIAALKALGLWGDGEVTMDPSYPGRFTTKHDGARYIEERKARDAALDIWDRAQPAKGTPVEAYLRARGIKLPMSDQLRYAPRLKHSPSGLSFRAMIARISDDHGFCGIQRTYLDPNEPKKADVFPNKMSKGPMGAGAVRLRMPAGSGMLGIAEGIETALSAWQLYSIPCWATLSAQRLGKIEIPEAVQQILVFGDPGKIGQEFAVAAAEQYERNGKPVEVIFPAADFQTGPNDDFNAILQKDLPACLPTGMR